MRTARGRVFAAELPRAKLPIVRVVDMGTSNAWAEYAAIFVRTTGSPWRTLWRRTRTSRTREIRTQVAVEVEPYVFLTD